MYQKINAIQTLIVKCNLMNELSFNGPYKTLHEFMFEEENGSGVTVQPDFDLVTCWNHSADNSSVRTFFFKWWSSTLIYHRRNCGHVSFHGVKRGCVGDCHVNDDTITPLNDDEVEILRLLVAGRRLIPKEAPFILPSILNVINSYYQRIGK